MNENWWYCKKCGSKNSNDNDKCQECGYSKSGTLKNSMKDVNLRYITSKSSDTWICECGEENSLLISKCGSCNQPRFKKDSSVIPNNYYSKKKYIYIVVGIIVFICLGIAVIKIRGGDQEIDNNIVENYTEDLSSEQTTVTTSITTEKTTTVKTTVTKKPVTTTSVTMKYIETNMYGVDINEWPELAALNLPNSTMMDIYNEYERMFKFYPDDPDEWDAYDEKMNKEIAGKYNVPEDQALDIYCYVLDNYDKVARGDNISESVGEPKLLHGELLEVKKNAGIVVVKAKIESSYSNEATIHQNYFNVTDLVKNQGFDVYNEIQYWAVADMTDGSESKVISFTVSKSLINRIKNGEVVDNQLGEYVDDLYILPSLKS